MEQETPKVLWNTLATEQGASSVLIHGVNDSWQHWSFTRLGVSVRCLRLEDQSHWLYCGETLIFLWYAAELLEVIIIIFRWGEYLNHVLRMKNRAYRAKEIAELTMPPQLPWEDVLQSAVTKYVFCRRESCYLTGGHSFLCFFPLLKICCVVACFVSCIISTFVSGSHQPIIFHKQ